MNPQTFLRVGADDEARTRYLHLGKVALYQMSYIRNCKRHCSRFLQRCQEFFKKNASSVKKRTARRAFSAMAVRFLSVLCVGVGALYGRSSKLPV